MSIPEKLPISSNELPKKTAFRPPEGYTIRWQIEWGTGFYVLRDPQGQELGLFEILPDKKTVEDVLIDHLKRKVVGETREEMTVFIILRDSNGKVVGSLDIKEPPENPIETMIEDLSNR